MLTADIPLNEFNRGLNRYVTQLGLNGPRMMRKELGELVKTLVKQSPPKDRNKSMRVMRAKVNSRFEKLNQSTNFDSVNVPTSKSGLKYLASTSRHLFAVASDADMTKATINELRAVFYRSRKQSGTYKLVVPFSKPRKLQKVSIATRIMTTKSKVKAVGDKIAKNFGRLKAGWLAPLVSGAVSVGGKFSPPKWVIAHKKGLRGGFINNLNVPQNPNFTIINRAKGVSDRQSKFYIDLALKIRAAAMKENARQILSGKYEYTY